MVGESNEWANPERGNQFTGCLLINPLSLAKRPDTYEFDLPSRLRLNGFPSEPNLSSDPRLVAHMELAKAVEL